MNDNYLLFVKYTIVDIGNNLRLCIGVHFGILSVVLGKFDRQSPAVHPREESPGSIGQDAG